MSDLSNILLLAVLGSFIALIGGILFLASSRLSRFLSKYSMAFAAGVMITVSYLGLLPESVHIIGDEAFVVALLAFLISYWFENVVFRLHHHDDHDEHDKKKGSVVPLVIVGDTIHNFIDGVAIAASYMVAPGLGLVTAISTLLHEIPHEIGDFGILLKNGFSRKKVLLVNVLSSLSTIVGALLVFYFSPDEVVSGYLLAVAAGMFVYLGASDFLPSACEGIKRSKSIMVVFLAAIIMYGTLAAIPHTHETEDAHEEGIESKYDEHEEEEDDHRD